MASPNKKRLIQNIGLLLLLVALVLFVIFYKDTKDNNTLYDKAIGAEVTEVIIHSEDHEDIVINNKDAVWKVTKPEEFIADKDKMRHLFTLLSEDAKTNYDVRGKDLASYGLDQNRLSVSFNGVKMIFGSLNAISQKRYILKGDKVYLISETVFGLLQSGIDGFKEPLEK
jgi:hypothetical protein